MGDTRQNEFADLLATYRVGKKPLSPLPNGSFGAMPYEGLASRHEQKFSDE
jgi:hypothetical protein